MSEVHNNSEAEKVPTLYLNSDGTGTLYISGCQYYMIDDIYAAVAVINDLYNKGDFNAARPVINLAFDLAKKAEQSSEKFRKTLTKLYGLAGDTYAELGDYDCALKFYKNFQCLKMQLKSNLFRDTQPLETIKLYQFRKFSNYALSNLLNRELTLSRPSVMNDVFDSLVFLWLNSPSYGTSAIHKKHLDPYKDSFNDYRIACFCEDNPKKNQYAIQNNLMWSHYADEHQGFCVEFLFNSDDFRKDEFNELTASRLFRVKYWNPNKDAPIGFENKTKGMTASIAFLTKHHDWNYENEVRLLEFAPQNGSIRKQYQLGEKTIIKAIYFGYRCPGANIQIIMELLKDKGIKFYKMEIDYSNIYKLRAIEI